MPQKVTVKIDCFLNNRIKNIQNDLNICGICIANRRKLNLLSVENTKNTRKIHHQ